MSIWYEGDCSLYVCCPNVIYGQDAADCNEPVVVLDSRMAGAAFCAQHAAVGVTAVEQQVQA